MQTSCIKNVKCAILQSIFRRLRYSNALVQHCWTNSPHKNVKIIRKLIYKKCWYEGHLEMCCFKLSACDRTGVYADHSTRLYELAIFGDTWFISARMMEGRVCREFLPCRIFYFSCHYLLLFIYNILQALKIT